VSPHPKSAKGSVTEVTDEFISGSLNGLHNSKFEGSNQEEHLDGSSGGDSIGAEEGGNSVSGFYEDPQPGPIVL
jgi:hypothetical protein